MIRQVWLDTDSTERLGDGTLWGVLIRFTDVGYEATTTTSIFTSVHVTAPDRLGALLAAQKKMELWAKRWNKEETKVIKHQRIKYIALPLFHGVSHAD